MTAEPPKDLQTPLNADLLRFVAGKSAHSDVSQALDEAMRSLGDVQEFCPEPSQYRYVLYSTQGVVFAFAVGMDAIGLRVGPSCLERAIRAGASGMAEIGEDWALFTLFRSNCPDVDLKFWALEAYAFARALKKVPPHIDFRPTDSQP
jgi:hypothetical protein